MTVLEREAEERQKDLAGVRNGKGFYHVTRAARQPDALDQFGDLGTKRRIEFGHPLWGEEAIEKPPVAGVLRGIDGDWNQAKWAAQKIKGIFG